MTRRKWYTYDFLTESQKLLERTPTISRRQASLRRRRDCRKLAQPRGSPGYRPIRRQSLQPGPRRSRRGLCKQYQRKKSGPEKSDERAGQFTGLPPPIHRPGYVASNALRPSELKCAGAPSSWNHILAFMLAGTLCSRIGSTYCRNTKYVPPSRHLGRRYDPMK
ncbi:hypothetical protein TNCV_3598701 [Trichonephila clavipes]|nr:hypothetical protein TNCV_3598701 [Trichonephila clavipes]